MILFLIGFSNKKCCYFVMDKIMLIVDVLSVCNKHIYFVFTYTYIIFASFYLNLNYAISKTLNTEVSNSFYFIKGQDYLFNSINLSYNPIKSRFSHRLVFNNIKNENSFKYISLNYYMFYQSNVQLVPRYLLYTIKYHF